QIPWTGSTGGGVCAVCRTGSASDHCRHSGIKSTVDLLGTDKMNMGINTACRHDHSLSGQSLCGSTHGHSGGNSVHDAGISGFSDSPDISVLDPYICLDDCCT